jgi:hypothetical protein
MDIYDAVTNKFLERNARGRAQVTIPADAASIVVLAPAGGELRRDGKRTLIGNAVVRYTQ